MKMRAAVNSESRPLFDRKYSLYKIVEAYTYVETGQKSGNVIISPVFNEEIPGN